MVGIAYAIFAIPSGYIAHRIGRKRAIRIALTVLTLVLLALFIFLPATEKLGLSGFKRVIAFWALLFAFGVFWVTVVTNSFPMLWQMADHGTMGIYTGLYYTFSPSGGYQRAPHHRSAHRFRRVSRDLPVRSGLHGRRVFDHGRRGQGRSRFG